MNQQGMLCTARLARIVCQAFRFLQAQTWPRIACTCTSLERTEVTFRYIYIVCICATWGQREGDESWWREMWKRKAGIGGDASFSVAGKDKVNFVPFTSLVLLRVVFRKGINSVSWSWLLFPLPGFSMSNPLLSMTPSLRWRVMQTIGVGLLKTPPSMPYWWILRRTLSGLLVWALITTRLGGGHPPLFMIDSSLRSLGTVTLAHRPKSPLLLTLDFKCSTLPGIVLVCWLIASLRALTVLLVCPTFAILSLSRNTCLLPVFILLPFMALNASHLALKLSRSSGRPLPVLFMVMLVPCHRLLLCFLGPRASLILSSVLPYASSHCFGFSW